MLNDKKTSQRLLEKNVDKNQKKMVNNNFSQGAVALSNQLRLAQNLSVYVEGVPCTMIKRHRRDWVKRMLIVRDVIVPNSQIESHWFRISADHCACNKILPLTKDPLRYGQNALLDLNL